jgi:hypothetical protein
MAEVTLQTISSISIRHQAGAKATVFGEETLLLPPLLLLVLPRGCHCWCTTRCS